MHVALVGAVALALLLGPPPGKGPKDKDKNPKADKDVVADRKDGFDKAQRDVYGSWARTRGCPPGLAKKNNGCLPPGLAKKRWTMGRPLPADLRWDPVPHDVLVRLGDPPRGYQYGIVDGDLLKLAIGTRLVVDAIEAIVD